MLSQGQYQSTCLSDPISALHRDGFAAPSRSVEQYDLGSIDQQKNYLENLAIQLRKSQIRMAKILKDAEIRHRKVLCILCFELFNLFSINIFFNLFTYFLLYTMTILAHACSCSFINFHHFPANLSTYSLVTESLIVIFIALFVCCYINGQLG